MAILSHFPNRDELSQRVADDRPIVVGVLILGPEPANLPSGRFARVRFSNRPFEVKHFQTIRRCSVDVAHGLVLLSGIGTNALPSWDSKTRRSNPSTPAFAAVEYPAVRNGLLGIENARRYP